MSLITVVLAFAVRAFGSCGPQVCLTFRVIEFHKDTPAPDKHSQTNHAHARIDKKMKSRPELQKESNHLLDHNKVKAPILVPPTSGNIWLIPREQSTNPFRKDCL